MGFVELDDPGPLSLRTYAEAKRYVLSNVSSMRSVLGDAEKLPKMADLRNNSMADLVFISPVGQEDMAAGA